MKLIYVLDPMCSWCWAFRPQLQQFLSRHPELELDLILGGLAPDSDQPMPTAQRHQIEQIWHQIAEQTGAEFNYEFWQKNTPRRSTYPACRAVIAADRLANKATEMVDAIQQAYYLRAMNPSDSSTLIQLAGELGISEGDFAEALAGEDVENQFKQDLSRARSMGISGFPALIVEIKGAYHALALGYTQCAKIEQRLSQLTAD